MKLFKKITLAATLSMGFIAHAQATNIQLNPGTGWHQFNVDPASAQSQGIEWIDTDSNSPDFGSVLHFLFSLPQDFTGFLYVVDAGFSGDRFDVFNNGASLGTTSATNNNSDFSLDFDNNWQNPNFSSALFILGQGSYDISGYLLSSLQTFNTTNGAIRLEAVGPSQVPEPSSFVLIFAGLGLVALMRLRKD